MSDNHQSVIDHNDNIKMSTNDESRSYISFGLVITPPSPPSSPPPSSSSSSSSSVTLLKEKFPSSSVQNDRFQLNDDSHCRNDRKVIHVIGR